MSKELSKDFADEAMYAAEPIAENRPRVSVVWATPEPLGAIAAACGIYKGEVHRDLSRLSRIERTEAWEQVRETHLLAPLEFVKIHFFLEGVTRAFTHQMVRQRTAVYAQESLRFAVKENLAEEAGLPPSLAGTAAAVEREAGLHPTSAEQARDVWDEALDSVQEAYDALIAMGVPAEDARGLLPHATTTRLHYATDLRALIDHAGNRLCTQAQFEWRYVFAEIVSALAEQGDEWKEIATSDAFRPVCFAKGRCPFKADFDRGCTIRGRADAGRFDEIKDAEWMLDPTAAIVPPSRA